ncbi:COP9 signalosome complex subunit 1 [Amborella trichopoda]|uniref:COP9 signalosome complex subunit 1 n=1 Tax=Amborella trichopoda TaxID=13333 RepID=UPI0009C080E6|nr:COP9 signalosome complex subunit 1 [Amborella trichopoda]|eukprot:XP_011628353.2 COP9 signalosome complex subunit 1 [Amborella trichopoda]
MKQFSHIENPLSRIKDNLNSTGLSHLKPVSLSPSQHRKASLSHIKAQAAMDEADGLAEMIDAPCSNGVDQKRPKAIMSGEHLDVEAYASLYSGRTKILRLIFIAEHCGNPVTQIEAVRMAYDELKKGENTQLLREVAEKINGNLGPEYGVDYAWIHSVERRAEQRKEKLENELSGYKTNMIKESIRMGYNDFGDFHYARGLLGDAFKNYVRTRDYCTTSKHIIQMCLNVILVSIETGQFMHVTNYVNKAEQTPELQDPIITAKLKCAAGLAHLEAKKYKPAARKFLETGPELGNNYTEVIAPQDVATYGGLCALACFDRTELKNKVIDNINFRNFLELVPEVRELIHDFYASRYASCLEYLENLKPNLLLDIHLYDHVETLYEQIRHKAIIQYTLPFISVDLRTMASAFKTTVAGLEKELEALITDNQIQARIDSHNKILYARHADQRNATFQRVLQTGVEFDRDVRAMLLRANLVKHEYIQRNSRKN